MGVSKHRGIPKMNGFIMENNIKMDDLGVSLFLETPMCIVFVFKQLDWTLILGVQNTTLPFGVMV